MINSCLLQFTINPESCFNLTARQHSCADSFTILTLVFQLLLCIFGSVKEVREICHDWTIQTMNMWIYTFKNKCSRDDRHETVLQQQETFINTSNSAVVNNLGNDDSWYIWFLKIIHDMIICDFKLICTFLRNMIN